MRNYNYTDEELEQLKKNVIQCVKNLIEDFNSEIFKEGKINFATNRNFITIDYRDDKKPNSQTFRNIFGISDKFLRELFKQVFKKDKYSHYHDLFSKRGLLEDPKKMEERGFSILKDTFFGNLFNKYISIITEHRMEKEFLKIIPLEYKIELFDKCWEGILPWISDVSVGIKFYYLFFNMKLKNNQFFLSKENNLLLKVPNRKERVDLINEIKFSHLDFEGIIKISNRISAIQNCGFWIEGKIDITRKNLLEKNTPKPLIHEIYFKEAFSLLLDSKMKLCFLTASNHYLPRRIFLYPNQVGEGSALDDFSDITLLPYPRVMEETLRSSQMPSIELKKEELDFLSKYPFFSRNLPRDSLERLVLDRYFNSLEKYEFKDIIIDTIFGIESLLVTGRGELKWKFRTNTSWLVGKNYEDRKKIDFFCSQLYELRSKIVHEGGKHRALEKIVKIIGGFNSTKKLVVQLFRLVILQFLKIENNKLVFEKRENNIDLIKNAIIGKELKFKRTSIYKLHYKNFMEKLSSTIN